MSIKSGEETNDQLKRTRSARERRERMRQRATAVWGIVTDYAENSTVHGIRYLCEKNRPIVERIWWIIVIIISISVCSKMIYEIYQKWVEEPVIVSFAEKATSIWGISFPAITLCIPVKAAKQSFNLSDAQEAVNLYKNGNDDYNRTLVLKYETLSHVMHMPQEHYNVSLGEYDGKKYFKTMVDIAPLAAFDVNLTCQFSNADINCNEYVTEIMTDEGICYSFNIIDPDEIYRNFDNHKYMNNRLEKLTGFKKPPVYAWDLDLGYLNFPWEKSYPFRVTQNTETDLFITFSLPADEFNNGFDLDEKYKLIVHSPAEIPKLSKGYISIPFNQNADINVRLDMMRTSDTLKNYLPERRQCYYNRERELNFFKIYTQKNCEQECLTYYTLDRCGCVKFTMPRDSYMKICGIDKIKCYKDAKKDFEKMLFLQNTDDIIKSCDCLQGCTLISYHSEVITSIDEQPVDLKVGKLSITLNKNDFFASHRSERFGTVDFIASFGGLLGLFMGVSIISIIEIIYYFTLRFMCNVGMRWNARRRTLRKQRKLKPKIDEPLEIVDADVDEEEEHDPDTDVDDVHKLENGLEKD